ncbi:hypothetical protein DXG01_003871 [Tephrocybe rancida]|nr:hypothetical protein DXG01_003871 [Tephrocybe rancida]
MGPPLSPRETRRSGRRSLPSASTSASKSPDSDPPPRQKDFPARPPLNSNNSSGRHKRLKQEDIEDTVDERKNPSAPSTSSSSSTTNGTTAGRNKRKAKDKDKEKQVTLETIPPGDAIDSVQNLPQDAPEEEEQGITRCVCGSTGEDDPDAGEFMVQCETCKVWQHGLCMGFESEDQLYDDDYYCEECKPELHTDLLKKRSKRPPRQSSANSHHNPASAPSRVSRSHSPSTLLKQPSKRRNTMNSRDAAFDEKLKEIIEATAAEAAAAHDNASVTSGGTRDAQQANDDEADPGPGSRKKRKRVEEDIQPKKRTRSASTTSDHPGSVIRDGTPGQVRALTQPTPAPSKPARSNKRGGKKAAPAALIVDALVAIDTEEVQAPLSTTKRQGNNSRAKSSQGSKRPPASHSHSHGVTGGDHSVRRAPLNGPTSQTPGLSANESARAYRNSHAYAVSQQPLYTSWNLPDYLAHLEPMLPTESPRPLEVRGSVAASGAGRGESVDHTVERGVKIKWPSKRMSVGDMNKRVRSLVEWVGREQATAQDRSRRRGALAQAYQEELKNGKRSTGTGGELEDASMVVDDVEGEQAGQPVSNNVSRTSPPAPAFQLDDTQSSATMKLMEELMEELIRFQERFGPGARSRDRDRRVITSLIKLKEGYSTHFRYVVDEDSASTLRQPSPGLSDNAEEHPGDYSTRMDELFDDGDDEAEPVADVDDDEDGEGFVYAGVDAPDIPTGYTDRLRDVLGSELTDDDSDVLEVEMSSVHDHDDAHSLDRLREDVLANHAPSTSPSLQSVEHVHAESTSPSGALKFARPFLSPSVSRLRSFTPQSGRLASNGSGGSGMTSYSHIHEGISATPSHFSSMSRRSSRSNLNSASGQPVKPMGQSTHLERDVFKWTKLANISEHMYNSLTQKLSSVLGAPMLGTPTVLAANGLICVGTDKGKICVYDFKQRLKCVCGNETHGKTVGAVTAVALSHDHTYVASGHASGHIQLFDLKNPKVPARFVPPTTFGAVASGRKEGHIEGSRIVSVDFIARRHTAVVSSDDRGLAFSHSLGKMLFVEAPDILRILGQYQPDTLQHPISAIGAAPAHTIPDTSLPRRRKARYTILATVPLPLGTFPHATDQYNVIAMLTPSKLVVVGLKPTPRTWFKCPRDVEDGSSSKARGTLAWCPSVVSKPISESLSTTDGHTCTTPMLVFTWGHSLRLIRVDEFKSRETTRNSRTGKQIEVEVGRIIYQDAGHWSAESNILAVQWLNAQVLDIHTLNVIDSVSFDGLSLLSPSLASTVNGAVSYSESVGDVAHSMRVYKGKIFLLKFTLQCRTELRVGTLLTWADRVLAFVEDGDFLSAIDLTRSYYVGDAPGNRNGLPDDPILRKEAIGGKMKDLMIASARYAFSEDRMSDGTHTTPDGRGVDRTSLFEGLVTVSCRASIVLDDYDYLFEDLFQQFEDTGISKIFVRQLEPFVLDNDMHYIPPRITQRLVALHEEDNRPDRIERIIWHIDPMCLDIHQTIHLCQRYHLYDALIYVYSRALRDFVAPLVELLDLIRKVQQFRRTRSESMEPHEIPEAEATMESTILNAYKIYPYLSNILSGLSYPSEDPLPDEDAFRAKKEVYTFLFFGRSSVWPPGEESRLVLTADEEGGAEPTYPYVRQLLRFDAESFLHSLDIAFEDSFLNDDESQGTNRLLIVRILMEILTAGDLSSTDSTFVNIFIARNVPKYPQFLQIPPSALHDIIIGLAEDPDFDTREDRQLAAEYLLSTYNPHDSEYIINLFETAGFYRILRTWHRQEHRWGLLLSAYLDDYELRPSEVLHNVDEVLTTNSRSNKGVVSPDIHATLSAALPQLLRSGLPNTAYILDKYAPDLHEAALRNLPDDQHRFMYLRHLLGPPERDDDASYSTVGGPSVKVPADLRQLYITLQCQQHPDGIIEALKYLPSEALDWNSVLLTCEAEEAYDAVVWVANWRGNPQEALRKAEAYQKRLTQRILTSVLEPSIGRTNENRDTESLVSIAKIGIAICLEHSQASPKNKVPLEDIWFQLLSSQIHSVQALSSSQSELFENRCDHDDTLTTLRALVQRTFAALISVTTTQAVSFPSLFKRLVDSAPPFMHAQYTEFRAILSGMLETYRSEGDMLVITKHLVDRDLFETMARIVQERHRGWSPFLTSCAHCRKTVFVNTSPTVPHYGTVDTPLPNIVVCRTGLIYHKTCPM